MNHSGFGEDGDLWGVKGEHPLQMISPFLSVLFVKYVYSLTFYNDINYFFLIC